MGELALWKTSPEQAAASEMRMSVQIQMPTVSASSPVPDTPGKVANDDTQLESVQPEPEEDAAVLANILVDNGLVADIDGPSEDLR